MNEAYWDDYEMPKENQSIVKVLRSRGNNLHEVNMADYILALVSNHFIIVNHYKKMFIR